MPKKTYKPEEIVAKLRQADPSAAWRILIVHVVRRQPQRLAESHCIAA